MSCEYGNQLFQILAVENEAAAIITVAKKTKIDPLPLKFILNRPNAKIIAVDIQIADVAIAFDVSFMGLGTFCLTTQAQRQPEPFAAAHD